MEPSGRRTRATVSDRVLRSVSACALPRPSAIASAKFANSTVNQRNSATRPVKTFSFVDEEPRSLKNRIVVSTDAHPDDEHHRVAHERPRVQLDEAVARSPAAGSPVRRTWCHEASGAAPFSQIFELLDDGAERQRGKERECGDDHATPMTSTTNSGVSVGNVPDGRGDLPLADDANRRARASG